MYIRNLATQDEIQYVTVRKTLKTKGEILQLFQKILSMIIIYKQ